jgi:hypothetical protein
MQREDRVILSAYENLASCARAFSRIVALENLVVERLQIRFPALLSTKDHAHKMLNFHVRRVKKQARWAYLLKRVTLDRL